MLGAVRKKRRLFPPLACFLLLLLLPGLSSRQADDEERRVTEPRLKRIQKHFGEDQQAPYPHHSGVACQRDTLSQGGVPVRRTNVDDVLRAKSLFDYGRKQQQQRRSRSPPPPPLAPDMVSGNGHEHAIAYTGSTSEVYGAKATINVWEPRIEQGNEFSLSQMWILSGSFDGSDLKSIEDGWQSGFVQTTSMIAIGAAIPPVSSFSGNQFDITILIWKDPKLGNWWMSIGDNILVGYWPSELFTHLADHATMVEFGGEVVNSRAEDGAHTTTQMGLGRFAGDGLEHASYFQNLEVVDSDNSLSAIQAISTVAEDTNCYNIRSSYDDEWGAHFFYDGPGKNPRCP